MFRHPQRLSCEDCAAVFTGRDGLVRHRRTKHGFIVSTYRKYNICLPEGVVVVLVLCCDFYLVVVIFVIVSCYFFFVVLIIFCAFYFYISKHTLIRTIQNLV